jgi:enoyl-CoA hydratase/carnithine racemase
MSRPPVQRECHRQRTVDKRVEDLARAGAAALSCEARISNTLRRMTEAVRYERDGDIGIITLDRPDNRNSMTPELLDAFVAASAAARADIGVRVVIVTGRGSSFSAGADFKSNIQRDGDTRAPHERSFAMYEPFLSLLDLAVPVVGALNGHAVGGGFGLALVCDIRIGALEAKYGANFVKLGLAPGMAISYLLPRVVGLPRANELLLTGRLVDGAEALALGILNRAVPAADVLSTALALARDIAAAAPLAVRATKAAIRRGLALHVREAAQLEAYAQAESLATDDAREGIAALLAKRAPQFTGR